MTPQERRERAHREALAAHPDNDRERETLEIHLYHKYTMMEKEKDEV